MNWIRYFVYFSMYWAKKEINYIIYIWRMVSNTDIFACIRTFFNRHQENSQPENSHLQNSHPSNSPPWKIPTHKIPTCNIITRVFNFFVLPLLPPSSLILPVRLFCGNVLKVMKSEIQKSMYQKNCSLPVKMLVKFDNRSLL